MSASSLEFSNLHCSRNGTTFSTSLIKYEGHVLLCFNYQAVNTAESKIASLEKKKEKFYGAAIQKLICQDQRIVQLKNS